MQFYVHKCNHYNKKCNYSNTGNIYFVFLIYCFILILTWILTYYFIDKYTYIYIMSLINIYIYIVSWAVSSVQKPPYLFLSPVALHSHSARMAMCTIQPFVTWYNLNHESNSIHKSASKLKSFRKRKHRWVTWAVHCFSVDGRYYYLN